MALCSQYQPELLGIRNAYVINGTIKQEMIMVKISGEGTRSVTIAAALLGIGLAAACGGTAKPAEGPTTNTDKCNSESTPPAIVGTYKGIQSDSHSIEDKRWIQRGPGTNFTFSYCVVDNSQSRLIAQNDSGNKYNPNLFSAFYWTRTDGGTKLWFCQQVYDAKTMRDALSASPPDSTNPAKGGCGGKNNFPWEELTAEH